MEVAVFVAAKCMLGFSAIALSGFLAPVTSTLRSPTQQHCLSVQTCIVELHKHHPGMPHRTPLRVCWKRGQEGPVIGICKSIFV